MPVPTNDYSQERVPDNQTVTSGHIALVIIGGTIGIPAFLMAAQVSHGLGFIQSVLAFVCGALILGGLNASTSWIGAVTRLSSSKLTEQAFGLHGAKLINGLIALTLAGWYGVICNMFGDAANTILVNAGLTLPVEIYMVLGSALMLAVSLKGFSGIEKLANWLVPFMILFIFYAAKLSLESAEVARLWEVNSHISFVSAVSAVVGAYIVGVVIQPDYSRFAKNPKGAAIAAGFSLAFIFPLVLILTSIPAIISQQADLILIMLTIGIAGPAFFLLLLSSWSSNVLCLYSSSLTINTITPNISLKAITITIATVGTVIAFTNVLDYFIEFLIFLGICIPPVGAIYCLNYYFHRKELGKQLVGKYRYVALIAWLFGFLFGWMSYQQIFSITQVAALDSIIVSASLFLIIEASIKRLADQKS